jgi:endoglucanase
MLSKIEGKCFTGCSAGYIPAAFKKFAVVFIFLCVVTPLYAIPPRLHVDGNKVKDPNGNNVILRGVCTIDLGQLEEWQGGALNMIDRLTNKDDTQGNSPGWYTKIIRIMIAPPDSTDPAGSWPHPFNKDNNDLYNILRTFVDYCGEKEVYVSIDWHYCANTYDHITSTSEFWTYMAPRFKDDTHVIYELFNEPINNIGSDSANWTSVKTDMETWIGIVRASAPDTLIFVGTPRWCQIIGPTATDPVDDVNVVYITHIYPYHWLSGNQYYRDNITAAAAVHPVILGEWGFAATASDDQQHTVGTISNYSRPLKEFVESIGIGSMAWVASYNWEPPMFATDWTLLCGEGYMGGFAKDWLFETSGTEQTIDLTITRCKVTAGKVQGQDVFEASGTMASSPLILSSVAQIDINIVSLADGNGIYRETIGFDSSQVVKNNYKYAPPKGTDRGITSLTMNFSKKTFTIKTKNINLTGLACPLQLNITIGNYTLSGDVDETIVNGTKTIPTRLMRMYKNTLIVPPGKAKVKSDSLSVSGEIAVEDINDANMDEPSLVAQDVNIVWGSQTFTIPADSFSAVKGHSYKCSKINVNPNGIVTATIDFDKCTFAVSIAKANIDAVIGDVMFGISFNTEEGTFDEEDDYTLP